MGVMVGLLKVNCGPHRAAVAGRRFGLSGTGGRRSFVCDSWNLALKEWKLIVAS